MLAANTFFSSQAMLAVVIALVGLAAFAMGWLLLGTAARVKADRDMAARMAAIGRPVPQHSASPVGRPGSGWIPESVSAFGERFATAQGFSERLDAEIQLGRPADDALEALADRVGSPDFRWAVLAVNIQREVGGNLAEILDNVADTLRERATMRRQIRVLTAEGRLSAWVLAILPFAIGIYMFAVNPRYISTLFTTQVGLIMLGTGGVLMVLGIL